MKTTKTKLAAFKKSLADKFSREADVRKSADTGSVVEIKETDYCFTKYLRGVIQGDWDGAKDELALSKALNQATGTAGGFLVPEQTTNNIIELLSEKAVMRSMPGVRTISDIKEKLVLSRQDTASNISWGGENVEITENTNPTFGEISLEPHKMVGMQKISAEMLKNASPSVDSIVIADMAREAALEEDRVILEGTGGNQPLGFYYHPNVKNTDLSASITFTDILEAMYQIEIAHANITGWVGNPRTKHTLRTITSGTGGTGTYIYQENRISDEANSVIATLYGVPCKWTTQLPITNRPASNESYMVAGDWNNLIIGEGRQMRIDTTTTGGDAFAKDQIHIRLIREFDTALRHPETFVVVKGIQV